MHPPEMLPFSAPFSSMDKIRARITANARLIQFERSRLELISRMSGISLADSPVALRGSTDVNNRKKPQQQLPSPLLGGSVVSLDQEQRDAEIYRQLVNYSRTATAGKKTPPIPVVRPPSIVSDSLEAARIEISAQKKLQTAPLKAASPAPPPQQQQPRIPCGNFI